MEHRPTTDAVKVFLRVRPQEGRKALVCSAPNEVILDQTAYTFDDVGGEDTTQAAVFQAVGAPIVDACLAGYNGTIFAYGQTGAGKTYTMYGNMVDEDERGLAPRVLERLFTEMGATCDALEDGVKRHFDCRCSLVEIYNEHFADLLDPLPPPETTRFGGVKVRDDARTDKKVVLREDASRGVYVEGVKEVVVTSAKEALQSLTAGLTSRHVSSTAMNEASSRSHTVFTLNVEMVQISFDGVRRVKRSQLHLVDLAGSERQKDTQASGVRLREACAINQSLSTLGNCIKALVSGQAKPPYRESKLTFLLKDSLGGNAKTCIVANVSALERCCSETLGTLRFAQRAKMMPNRAVVNEESHGSVAALRDEIARLRAQLEQMPPSCPINNALANQGNEDLQIRVHRLEELLRGTMAQQQDLQDDRDLACKRQRAMTSVLEVRKRQVLALRLQLRLREEKIRGDPIKHANMETYPDANSAPPAVESEASAHVDMGLTSAVPTADHPMEERAPAADRGEVALVEPWPCAQLVQASLECELLHERNQILEQRIIQLEGGEGSSRLLRQKEKQVMSLQAEMLQCSRTSVDRVRKKQEELSASQQEVEALRSQIQAVKEKHSADTQMLVTEYEKAIAAILSKRRMSERNDGDRSPDRDALPCVASVGPQEIEQMLAQAEIALSLKSKTLAEREAELVFLREQLAAAPTSADASRKEAELLAQVEHEQEFARVAAQEAAWASSRVEELEAKLSASIASLREEETKTERLRFQLTMREEDEYDLSEEVDLLRSQIAVANERLEELQETEIQYKSNLAQRCVNQTVRAAIDSVVRAFPSIRECQLEKELQQARAQLTSAVCSNTTALTHARQQLAEQAVQLADARKAVCDAMAVVAAVEVERDVASANLTLAHTRCEEMEMVIQSGRSDLDGAKARLSELTNEKYAVEAALKVDIACRIEASTVVQKIFSEELAYDEYLRDDLLQEKHKLLLHVEKVNHESVALTAENASIHTAMQEAAASAAQALENARSTFAVELKELKSSLAAEKEWGEASRSECLAARNEASAKARSLEDARAAHAAELDELKAALLTEKEQVEVTRAECLAARNEASAKARSLEDARAAHAAELDELKAALLTEKEQGEVTRAECLAARNEASVKARSLEDARAAHAAELDELKAALLTEKEQGEVTRAECLAARNEASAKARSLEDARAAHAAELDELKAALLTEKEQVEVTRAECLAARNEASAKARSLEDARAAHAAELDELKAALLTEKERVEVTRAECLAARNEASAKARSLEDARAAHAAELDELKAALLTERERVEASQAECLAALNEVAIARVATSAGESARATLEAGHEMLIADMAKELQAAIARAAAAEEERDAKVKILEKFSIEEHHKMQTRLQTSLKEQKETLLRVMQDARAMAEASSAEAREAREKTNALEAELLSLQAAHEALVAKEAEQASELARLIGHTNHAQKIQHHLKIKDENNQLRQDVKSLKEQLQRLQKDGSRPARGKENPGASRKAHADEASAHDSQVNSQLRAKVQAQQSENVELQRELQRVLLILKESSGDELRNVNSKDDFSIKADGPSPRAQVIGLATKVQRLKRTLEDAQRSSKEHERLIWALRQELALRRDDVAQSPLGCACPK